MLKFVVIVLCHFILYYVSKAMSVPIIKASGVQWSEPRGSGKGNITLIMIPQNDSCGNDSDVIVAVKSEYQILSQDTQLLNLVVKEETNATGCADHAVTSPRSPSRETAAVAADRGRLNCPNTASFFQPAQQQAAAAAAASNNSAIILTNGKPVNLERETASTVNIFKLLNLVDPSEKKSYSIKTTQSPPTSSIHDLFKFLNVPLTSVNQNRPQSTVKAVNDGTVKAVGDSKVKVVGESTVKVIGDVTVKAVGDVTVKAVGESKSETVPFKIDSEDPFYNEALNVIEKLKQDPTYYESIAVKSNSANNTSDAGRGKPVYRDSKVLRGYLALEGEDSAGDVESERLKAEEIDPAIAACLSSTIGNGQSSTGASEQQSPATPSPGESAATGTAATTGSSTEQSSSADSNQTTPEIAGIMAATVATSSVSYVAGQPIALGGREPVMTTEMCTTLILRCGPLTSEESGVFHDIVNVVNGAGNESASSVASTLSSDVTAAGSETTVSKSVEVGSSVAALEVTNAGAAAAGGSETAINCNVSSTVPQSEKLPRKITLEPRINCDHLLKMNALTASAEPSGAPESQLKEMSPFLESAVFLANNNEISKGKNIPLLLNSSLDEFSLTDLQDKSDKIDGKAAELYNNSPLAPDLGQLKTIELSSAESGPVKSNGKRRVIIRNRSRDRGKIINPDLNRILQMQLVGNNLVLKKPAYKYEINEKHCDSTQKIKNDLPHTGLEPSDEEENISNAEPKVVPVVKTQSTSITHNEGNDRNKQNEQIETISRSQSNEDRGIKRPFNGDKTTRKPISNESEENNKGMDKIDTFNKNKHKTTEKSTVCEDIEDESDTSIQISTKMDNDRKTKQNSDSAKISTSKSKVPETDEDNINELSSLCDSIYEGTTEKMVTKEINKGKEFRVATTTSTTIRTSRTSRTTQRLDNHKDSEKDEGTTEEVREREKVATKKDRNQLAANEDSDTRRTTEVQCQPKSCGGNINIPANSVKEIVIKIIRTTNKPTQNGKTGSDAYYNNRREQNGLRPIFARPSELQKSNYGYEDNSASSNIKQQLERPSMTGVNYEAPQPPASARVLDVLDGVDQEQLQLETQKPHPFMIRNYGLPTQINYQQNLQNGAPLGDMCPVINNKKSEHFLAEKRTSLEHQYPYLTGTRTLPEHRYPSEQAINSMYKPNIIDDLSVPPKMIVDRNGKSLGSNILKLLLNDKSVIKTV